MTVKGTSGVERWRATFIGIIITVGVTPVLLLRAFDIADARAWWLLLPVTVGAAFIGHRLIRPLTQLRRAAMRLRRGELEARPETRLHEPWQPIADELFDLADRLQEVTEHLEAQVHERTAELEHKANQLRALGSVGQQVAAVLEPGELLHFVVRLVRGTFGYDLVAVVQQREGHLIVSACAAHKLDDPPVGKILREDEPTTQRLWRVLADDAGEADTADDPVPVAAAIPVRSELVVPIRLAERTVGLFIVQSTQSDTFDGDDTFTVKTIAGQVAVALENARLFDTERRLRSLAVTEERNRFAREIHDTLAQGFMGILMHLRAMHGESDGDAADVHRRQAESLAQQSLDEARRSVWNLRPAGLDDDTLSAALERTLDRLQHQTKAQIEFDTPGDRAAMDELPPRHAAALLRIAQEALHNVAKHARASHVNMRLHVTKGEVELSVRDDGIGFKSETCGGAVHAEDVSDTAAPGPGATSPSESPVGSDDGEHDGLSPKPGFESDIVLPSASRPSFGILGMKERAQKLGGTLHIESTPCEGTTVRVSLPLASTLASAEQPGDEGNAGNNVRSDYR